jgi:hypothetical protein
MLLAAGAFWAVELFGNAFWHALSLKAHQLAA